MSAGSEPDCRCAMPKPNGRGECSTCGGFACEYAGRGQTRCRPAICDCFIATHPFDNPRGLHPEVTNSHEIRYPVDSTRVACSCGWSTAVPLGHSLHDAYLDQHYSHVFPPGERPGGGA